MSLSTRGGEMETAPRPARWVMALASATLVLQLVFLTPFAVPLVWAYKPHWPRWVKWTLTAWGALLLLLAIGRASSG